MHNKGDAWNDKKEIKKNACIIIKRGGGGTKGIKGCISKTVAENWLWVKTGPRQLGYADHIQAVGLIQRPWSDKRGKQQWSSDSRSYDPYLRAHRTTKGWRVGSKEGDVYMLSLSETSFKVVVMYSDVVWWLVDSKKEWWFILYGFVDKFGCANLVFVWIFGLWLWFGGYTVWLCVWRFGIVYVELVVFWWGYMLFNVSWVFLEKKEYLISFGTAEFELWFLLGSVKFWTPASEFEEVQKCPWLGQQGH